MASDNGSAETGQDGEAGKALSVLARPEALTGRVAGLIRQAILSGELAPGERLSVPELARRLGVSRTPARESLLLLEREGLVVPRSSAGMAVIAGGREEILDLLDIREGLEIMTARRAAERIDAAWAPVAPVTRIGARLVASCMGQGVDQRLGIGKRRTHLIEWVMRWAPAF